eukprot:TRINITY_DN1901_c1_g1_i1.p1 TRINITY_DN1901_c1_g1~~TRINITY_DN1901_c1_g1_i1.p1  ORF type:complete len:1123 (+),score=151.60 TRINITY_DN1901_c1_g1_i1:451-3369(+)
MAAILGPSGAGKTTFMNALCGKAYYGRQTGDIYVNGKKSSIAALKSVRGFVPQDDTVHEKLTVRENLWYSARLGNPDFSPKEVENIVDDVLNVMQLTHVQHTVVGDSEERGISGGQKKRVNIGIELVSRPSVLMLDEPTSGLDSTTALSIIHSLKNLAEMGMTVVMSIHQPRYSLFELFDEVLLLGLGGRTVFLGPSDGALPYFEGLGFELPKNENPADWFMDVIAGKIPNNSIAEFKPHMLFGFWMEHSGQLPPLSPASPQFAPRAPSQWSVSASPRAGSRCGTSAKSSPRARSVDASPHVGWRRGASEKSSPRARSVDSRSPREKSADVNLSSTAVSQQKSQKSDKSAVSSGIPMISVSSDVLSPPCAPCPSPACLSPGAVRPSAWRRSAGWLRGTAGPRAASPSQPAFTLADREDHATASKLVDAMSAEDAVQSLARHVSDPAGLPNNGCCTDEAATVFARQISDPAGLLGDDGGRDQAAMVPKSVTPGAKLSPPTASKLAGSAFGSPTLAAERAARSQAFGPTLLASPRRLANQMPPCKQGLREADVAPACSDLNKKPSLPVELISSHSSLGPEAELQRLQQSLDDKWERVDLDRDGVLNRKELSAMLTMADDSQPSEAVLDELTERMGFENGVLSKEKLLEFLLHLQGTSSEQVAIDINGCTPSPVHATPTATPASRRYPSTVLKRPASFSLARGLPFCSQYVVLLHQSAVRWLRQWKQRAFSIALIVGAAVIFGHESMDKLAISSPLAPLRLNVSHCALGLMTAMPTLMVFGSDRPVFWRMSSSGMNVLAFFLARITLCLVDVMIFAYVFTSLWYLNASAPYNFWTYFRAFRLSAVSGATWGLLMSTMVPPHSSTLAVAVVILVMGSAISEPMTIAEAPGTYRYWLALVSPFTWSVGQNYLVEVDDVGEDKVLSFTMPIVRGYQGVMHVGSWQHTLSTYAASGVLAALTLTASYVCLRFTHRGKQV